jgi:uncharacterized membrane protein
MAESACRPNNDIDWISMSLLFAALFLVIPAAVLWLTHHQDWARKIGIIVLCYVSGLLLGNTGLIPSQVLPVQQAFTDISILLALPLLLFTLDIRQWSRVAGKAMLSMVFATTSVVALATSLFFVFRGQGVESASHFAAMSVGVYTGGTPNLAAIKAGLEIPHSQYIVFHSLDTLAGATYLLLMLTLGIPVFRTLLTRPPQVAPTSVEERHHFDSDDFSDLLAPDKRAQVIKAAALSALVVALSLGLSELTAAVFSAAKSSATVIVALTTLGIGLSLIQRVRQMHLSYKLGMYLIYVFCFVVASMANLENLARVDVAVAVFLFGTIAGSLLLHALLCKLAGIDSDTFMVTSVAAVCSPPFVPMIARALGNPGAMLSGMTTGIIGYALGNYLGISLALLLQSL